MSTKTRLFSCTLSTNQRACVFRLDDEIRYRQEVEAKNNELADMAAFEKRIHGQEVENFRAQLASAQEIIHGMEARATSSVSTYNEVHDKALQDMRKEHASMRDKCARLEQQNEMLKNDCRRLENVVCFGCLHVLLKFLKINFSSEVKTEY